MFLRMLADRWKGTDLGRGSAPWDIAAYTGAHMPEHTAESTALEFEDASESVIK